MIQEQDYNRLLATISSRAAKLVAVSKFQTIEKIEALYAMGQRDFGENYVQELLTKYEYFKDKPEYQDIRWHFIGHLQRNKVKYLAPFIYMIHSVDNFKLIREIQKEAQKNSRVVPVLLQFHIAEEDSKFGLTTTGVVELMSYVDVQKADLGNVSITGVMGMATFSDDETKVRAEFKKLSDIFHYLKSSYFLADKDFKEISMGMSADYEWAIEEGSTMVRIGSTLFGNRATPV